MKLLFLKLLRWLPNTTKNHIAIESAIATETLANERKTRGR